MATKGISVEDAQKGSVDSWKAGFSEAVYLLYWHRDLMLKVFGEDTVPVRTLDRLNQQMAVHFEERSKGFMGML